MYQQTPLQNYGYYQPARPAYAGSAVSFSGLKGRPVASLEEARASIIDFDGSIFYFPDLANKCIYTKQINADGTAQINMYALTEIPIVPEQKPPAFNLQNFVTKDEFNQAINQLLELAYARPNVQVSPPPEVAAAAQPDPLVLNF